MHSRLRLAVVSALLLAASRPASAIRGPIGEPDRVAQRRADAVERLRGALALAAGKIPDERILVYLRADSDYRSVSWASEDGINVTLSREKMYETDQVTLASVADLRQAGFVIMTGEIIGEKETAHHVVDARALEGADELEPAELVRHTRASAIESSVLDQLVREAIDRRVHEVQAKLIRERLKAPVFQ